MFLIFSFDIADGGLNTDDRRRINLAFRRLGWQAQGGSVWRYSSSSTPGTVDDLMNHVLPALFYFRSLVAAKGLNVINQSLTGDINTFQAEASVGLIHSASEMVFASQAGLGSTQNKLSEDRLRRFFNDAEGSLLQSVEAS